MHAMSKRIRAYFRGTPEGDAYWEGFGDGGDKNFQMLAVVVGLAAFVAILDGHPVETVAAVIGAVTLIVLVLWFLSLIWRWVRSM